MRMITDDEENQLRSKYGDPYYYKAKRFSGLNQQYFAGYVARSYELIYYLPDGCFYTHSEKTGVWTPATDKKMIDLIGLAIHEYAVAVNIPEIENYRTKSFLAAILDLLKGQAESRDAFARRNGHFIHCANAVLIFDLESLAWVKKDFSPHFYSRNQNPIQYDPDKKCPRFIDLLLSKAITADDIQIVKLYLGQCLLGENLSQTFVIFVGTPGGGKSTLVNVFEGVIGRPNCGELRTEFLANRFEIGRASSKSLLTAKDVDPEFLSSAGANKIKAMTGNDTMTGEAKNSNAAYDILGNFNIIITSNSLLRIEFADDVEAWRRRILLISYENPPPAERITNLDQILLAEEGSGILNLALEGAAQLLKAGGVITKSTEQQARVAMLMKSSRPFDVFGKLYIHPTLDASITTEEAVSCFTKFCDKMKWPLVSERKAQLLFNEWMRTTFGAVLRTDIKRNNHNKRGYSGYQIKKNTAK